MSTVQLSNINKSYPSAGLAVRDIDLLIEDGELLVLVGPPGSGKSTLLRMIAGLEQPTSGSILIDGIDERHLKPRKRRVAMAEPGSLCPHMTVGENLGFSLRARGVHRRQVATRVDGIAQQLDLRHVLDRKPNQITRNQQRRASLGRAAISHPRVLLIDDLMERVATRPRAELRTELVRLQRSTSTTTIVATQDQIEAMAIADRVAVMRNGRIVQCDRPTNIYNHPADIFVGRYMGAPAMTIVRANIVRAIDGLALEIAGHTVAIDPATVNARPRLAQCVGREVGIGIRAEALRWDEGGSLVASVTSIEPPAPGRTDRLVHGALRTEGVEAGDTGVVITAGRYSPIAAYLPTTADISVWKPLPLRLDTRDLHVFDLETGEAICRTREKSREVQRR